MAFNYHCFNTQDRKQCEYCSNSGLVRIEESGEYSCPNNLSDLKLIGEDAVSVKTPTKDRFLDADRRKRNKDHFKKEVLPTITDSDSKKHHVKKLGYKN